MGTFGSRCLGKKVCLMVPSFPMSISPEGYGMADGDKQMLLPPVPPVLLSPIILSIFPLTDSPVWRCGLSDWFRTPRRLFFVFWRFLAFLVALFARPFVYAFEVAVCFGCSLLLARLRPLAIADYKI